ncbi:hypothetical protein R3P38DRAFT_2508437 [Favolaschia claudopus]|uniref:Protein kinase domain-containing protein n=1 Tax=Favolaschia claudopus TaxID=2862362 RepID=A0AAW0D0I1_9AGAR
MLGDSIYFSPEGSEDDSDSSSDETLEDLDQYQGYPLQRVTRAASSSGGGTSRLRRNSSSSVSSESSSTSSIVYDVDFEQLIDDLLAEDPCPLNETRNTVFVAASSPEANDSMTIKRLPDSSPELFLLLRLNQPEMRQDPWNPTPHILCAVSRDDYVFLCMQRLVEFNQPPLQIVSNYTDFFRQVLEGLSFLHEHSIAQLSCFDVHSYMVDLGPITSSASASVESFDRTRYPVRYYFTNLSKASEFEHRIDLAFQKDVEQCAVMMDRLSAFLPPSISTKLKTLINAMRTGTFDADASRKLFEALCKALPADVFQTPVPPYTSQTADVETLTVVMPIPSSSSSPNIRTMSLDDTLTDAFQPPTMIHLPRKPKSTSLTPRGSSRSPPGRVRAKSTDPAERLRLAELGLD